MCLPIWPDGDRTIQTVAPDGPEMREVADVAEGGDLQGESWPVTLTGTTGALARRRYDGGTNTSITSGTDRRSTT